MNDGAYNYFSSLVLQFLGWVSSLIYGMVSLVTQGFFLTCLIFKYLNLMSWNKLQLDYMLC